MVSKSRQSMEGTLRFRNPVLSLWSLWVMGVEIFPIPTKKWRIPNFSHSNQRKSKTDPWEPQETISSSSDTIRKTLCGTGKWSSHLGHQTELGRCEKENSSGESTRGGSPYETDTDRSDIWGNPFRRGFVATQRSNRSCDRPKDRSRKLWVMDLRAARYKLPLVPPK